MLKIVNFKVTKLPVAGHLKSQATRNLGAVRITALPPGAAPGRLEPGSLNQTKAFRTKGLLIEGSTIG